MTKPISIPPEVLAPITGDRSPRAVLEDARPEIDVHEVLRRLIARKWLIVLVAGLGFLFSVAYLHVVTPTYRAHYKVTPASSSPGGYASKASGLGGLAALAGVSVGGSASSATPFELYLDRLTSRDVAETLANDPRILKALFADQWDPTRNEWREPKSALRGVKNAVKGMLGIPVTRWRRPTGVDVQEYLETELEIVQPGLKDAPITEVVFNHRDPDLARYLLTQMDRVTDNRVRTEALTRASRYANYLAAKLRVITLNDQRLALSETLRQQEEAIMMASSGMSYAALIVAPPIASDRPTQPEPLSVLAAGLLMGLVVGSAVALFRPVAGRMVALS